LAVITFLHLIILFTYFLQQWC